MISACSSNDQELATRLCCLLTSAALPVPFPLFLGHFRHLVSGFNREALQLERELCRDRLLSIGCAAFGLPFERLAITCSHLPEIRRWQHRGSNPRPLGPPSLCLLHGHSTPREPPLLFSTEVPVSHADGSASPSSANLSPCPPTAFSSTKTWKLDQLYSGPLGLDGQMLARRWNAATDASGRLAFAARCSELSVLSLGALLSGVGGCDGSPILPAVPWLR